MKKNKSPLIAYCAQNQIRLTDPRKFVLDIIAASKKPLGAYEILAQLSKKLANPKPPTAYRAIEFLQAHGFIHRIESLNAYIACDAGHRHDGSQFLICDKCGTVTEAHICDIPNAIASKAAAAGFHTSHISFELHGTCHKCDGTKPSLPTCHHHDHL